MFNVVFNSYYGNVKQFLRDLFKSNSQAEQLAQKVFIRLWTTKHKIDTDGYLSSHIFETMCEITIKELRVISYETKANIKQFRGIANRHRQRSPYCA